MTKHIDHPRLTGNPLPPAGPEVCSAARCCPPHSWDCPVLMKLDPRSGAWTCTRCGAISTVRIGAPRP